MDPLAERALGALPELAAYGGQLHIAVGGDVSEVIAGEALVGEPLTDEHVFNVYCAAKPLAVMATLAALESSGVASDPATLLHELLPVLSTSPFGQLTLGDLLGHRAGLAAPDVFKFIMASDEMRAMLLARIDRTLPRRRYKNEHSTLAMSYVMTVLLRRMVGASLGEVVETHVRSVGLGHTFVRVPDGAAPVGLFVDRTRGRYLPMLHERLAYVRDSPYAELIGLYTTAGDLGRWGGELAAVLRGEERPGFPRASTVAAHLAAAAGVEGPSFAAGLARGLPEHGLAAAAPTALGQFGFVRTSLLYVDPAHDVVLAGIVTDLSMDDLDRRLRQWDEAIGAVTAAARVVGAG